MDRYVYDGPVMEFDKLVMGVWHGSTMAVSEKKARTNLSYQYKKTHNRTTNTRVSLPGQIIKETNYGN